MVSSTSPAAEESPYLRDGARENGSGSSPRRYQQTQRGYPEDIEDTIGPPLLRARSPGRRNRDLRQQSSQAAAQAAGYQLPPPQFQRGHTRPGSSGSMADVEMSDVNQTPFADIDAPEPTYFPRQSSLGEPLERSRSLTQNRRQSRSISSNTSSRGPSQRSRANSRAKQLTRLSEGYEDPIGPQYGGSSSSPRTPRRTRSRSRSRSSVRRAAEPPFQGEPFPPLPDSRMSMAGREGEDPRVQVLLEALRITTANQELNPPPLTARTPRTPTRMGSNRMGLDRRSTYGEMSQTGSNPAEMRSMPQDIPRAPTEMREMREMRPMPQDISQAELGGISPNEKDSTLYMSEFDGPPPPKEQEPGLDKNLVDWDGPDDPECPSNWPMLKKYKTSLILSLFSFIAPFSATMVGPAIDVIGAELDIAPGTEQRLIMGFQVLAAGIGPVFIAPLLEYFGRVPVIKYAHLWHLIWNTACGFAATGPQLLAFRFIGGLGASAPQIIAPGLTADVYPAPLGGRGDAVHAYLPFLGSAIAPIFGAFVTQDSNWRWIFWGTSIFSVVAVALAFFFLDETLHPRLLADKCEKLKQATGNPHLHTPYQIPGQTTKEWMSKKIALPYIMFFAHPVVQLPFGYRAYLYGIMYLFISTFDKNFVTFYGMDKISASLNFLALGIGFVLGLHISRYAIDEWSAYFRRKHNTKGHKPEWRLPVNAGAAILIPPALILYGWSLEMNWHYMVPDLAAFFLAIGLILGFFSLQPYVTESYGLEYASSAHAAGTVMQHVAEFAFPLVGPVIYTDLGRGWGNTLIAVVTLSIAILMPLILWHCGPALRRASNRGLPVEASARK